MDIIVFILFLVYTFAIFFVKAPVLLGAIGAANVLLMLILRINIKDAIIFCLKMLPIILFTAIFNIWFGSLELAFLIGIRLILVCNITYIFAKRQTPKKIGKTIEKALTPLKVFKVNTREIGIIISISLAFMPILQKEIQYLKYSLMSKGFDVNIWNILRKPNYILVPIVVSSIKKTAQIEESMISKGYAAD